MRSLRLDSPIVLLLAFSAFAVAPLTAPGYFIFGHDARHSVYFLQMFDFSVRDGAWYPRWATDMVFGYGYPLWILLAPLPFFVGEVFHLIGFDFVTAVKIVDGLAVIGSALTMYAFSSRVLSKNAGLVAAVAYAYIPYHLVDLNVRSAQPELVSFVFPPLILWAFYQLATTRSARYVPVAALAYGGALLNHIQSAALVTPIIGIYLLVLLFITRRSHFALRFTLYSAASIGLALGLAAIFLLPVLSEQRLLSPEPLIGGFFNYRNHFVNASQLLSPFWGYGYAGDKGNDQFSLQLGLVPLLLSFVALLYWRRISGDARWHTIFFGLVAFVLVLMMMPFSAPIWDLVAGIAAYLQFSWRILSIIALALAFLTGTALEALNEHGFAPALVVALVLVMASYPYTEPQHTDAVFNIQTQMDFEVKDGELLGDTIWLRGPRPTGSPLVAQYINGETLQKAVALDPGADIQMIRHGGQSDEVRVTSDAPVRLMFYTHYFPGWVARIDGQTAPISPYGDQGLILVNVPAGTHTVALRYEGTGAQAIGALISGICLLIVAGWLLVANRRVQARFALHIMPS